MSSSSDDEVPRLMTRTPNKVGRRLRRRTREDDSSDEEGERKSKSRAFKELRQRMEAKRDRRASAEAPKAADSEGSIDDGDPAENEIEEVYLSDSSEDSNCVSPNKRPRKLVDESDEEDEQGKESEEDEGREYSFTEEDFTRDISSHEEASDSSATKEEEDSSGVDDDVGRGKEEDFDTEFGDILANLSRSSEKHQRLNHIYHKSRCEEAMERRRRKREAETKRKKGKRLTFSDDDYEEDESPDVLKLKLYKPLMAGLRPMASKEGLSDIQIVREFVLYSLQIDEKCGGECICGKEGLK